MPTASDEMSEIAFDFRISAEAMDIIRKGHIPEAQENHWFMYCDDEYIRDYRSWKRIEHHGKEGMWMTEEWAYLANTDAIYNDTPKCLDFFNFWREQLAEVEPNDARRMITELEKEQRSDCNHPERQ